MAEIERKASAGLRKKAAPAKQVRLERQQVEAPDRAALVKAFDAAGDEPYLSTSVDQYGRYILVEVDPTSGQQSMVYLDIAANGRDFTRVTGSEVIKNAKAMYKDPETLRRELYDKGYISEREYKAKSTNAFNGAILQAAMEFSTDVADAYTTEGKITFPTFDKWVASRGSMGGEEDRGPRRDIQKYDRDVIRQMVVDAYLDSPNANLPDESIIERDTDKYMKMANEGTLTKAKKNKAGEYETVSTPGFSEQRLRDEIAKRRKTEFASDEKTRTDLDFLAFLSGLEG